MAIKVTAKLRKPPVRVTERFIEKTFEELFRIDARLRRLEKNLDAVLFEDRIQAQIKEVGGQ